MVKKGYFFGLLLLVCSCNTDKVHSEYKSLNNGIWRVTDTIAFEVEGLDTLNKHHVYFNIRNDNTYEFSNLFLITEFGLPNGKAIIDTLEYEMASPDGTWLGTGKGSIKESKLWFRENIVFGDSGVYTFKIAHAMRKNGEVQGMTNLKGITDIGLEIAKSTDP